MQFFNVLVIIYLFILKEHTCSSKKAECTPDTYALSLVQLIRFLIKAIKDISSNEEKKRKEGKADGWTDETIEKPRLWRPVTSDWIFESDIHPPANLTQELKVSDNGTARIVVYINDQREDFDLTLLANPFLNKNDSEYLPELNTSDYNLRQYYTTCRIFKEDNNTKLGYRKVFTGWYYFVVTNNDGTRWKYEPKYYETNYPFIDMRVQLKEKGTFHPEATDTTMSYSVDLRVPLDCITVNLKIYEREEKVDGAMGHIEYGRLVETQTCSIKNISEGNSYAVCELISHIKLDVSSTREVTNDRYNNTWIVHLMWKNLTPGGGNYYLDYSNHDPEKCVQQFGREAVETWGLIKGHIYVELGEHHEDGRIKPNAPEKTVIQPEHWLWITCVLVFLILFTMLFYWVMRWYRLKDLLREDENGAGIPKEPLKFINDKKSNQILLIYARGCSHFEKELEDVKERLRRFCTGYKIRDVYAPSEFKYVGDVKKWVDEILKAGSKVIWFDTPELRSRLNRQDPTWNDYRDEAVPYAFELARDLYQDAHSQYCYHFVVQMEEFKVEKDEDDPLRSFTPHTRWLLPGRFIDLCEKLNGLIEPSSKHQNFYTEMKFDSSSNNRTARII